MTESPKTAQTPSIDNLVPFVHVASVERSIDFYRRLGFHTGDTLDFEGRLGWAYLYRDRAQLMLSLASEPIDPAQQAVLFYLHTPDIAALRAHLLSQGITAGEIERPDHMPAGEIRVTDPDGYVLLIGQL